MSRIDTLTERDIESKDSRINLLEIENAELRIENMTLKSRNIQLSDEVFGLRNNLQQFSQKTTICSISA